LEDHAKQTEAAGGGGRARAPYCRATIEKKWEEGGEERENGGRGRRRGVGERRGGWRKQASRDVGHLVLEDDLDTAAATSFDFALFS
jgi:hypothetical protein